jgi:hypothetical protein
MSPRVLFFILTCASCSFALPTPPGPDANAQPSEPPRCAGYTAAGGSTYRLVTTALDWLASEQACEGDEPGASHLAIVDAMDELPAIHGITDTPVWVGMSDRVTENAWQWVSGVPQAIMAPLWKIGEPSRGPDDNCGLLDMADHADAVRCNDAHAYLCECDGVAPVATSY